MKHVLLPFLLAYTITAFAQLNSYSESEEEAQAYFDLTFSYHDDNETAVFTIGAKHEHELFYAFGISDGSKSKGSWRAVFASKVEADSIQLASTFYSSSPISEIFGRIEYQDVYRITKSED